MSHLIDKKMIKGKGATPEEREEDLKKIKVDGLNDCPNDQNL